MQVDWKKMRMSFKRNGNKIELKAVHYAELKLITCRELYKSWRQGICMDFITGLPKSEGKEVIFVVVDRSFYQICSLYGSLILYKLPKLLKCSLIRFIPCMVYQLKSYQTETLYLPVFSGLSYNP
jgi:hypothetical protein